MTLESKMGINIYPLFEALNNLQKCLECTICLELMTEPIKTRCGHSFCHFCIKRVLFKKKSASCPLCKKYISRRTISKDDHMETYIDKFKCVVIATQLDTHFDILSYLKQPRDTKESCSYSDASDFRDSNKRKSSKELSKYIHNSSPKSSGRTDAPSTSREASIDCNNPRQYNMNALSEKLVGFTGLSGVHPLPADENDDAIRTHSDAWYRSRLNISPNNQLMSIINKPELFNVINDGERDSLRKTWQNKTDKSYTKTKQVRKRSVNRAHIGDTSQDVNKKARQVDKVKKIDSVSGLKYIASHARIRANSKHKKNATKSGEQEIQENNTWENSLLANDQAHRKSLFNTPDRSVLNMSSASINDRQSSADWSRVIEVGKEMRPKKRKVKKLDVSIESKKNTSCIVENVALSPNSKYSLNEVIAHHSANEKDVSLNLLEKLQNQKQNAIDKDLSNTKRGQQISSKMKCEQSSGTDNSTNCSGMEAYIMLPEGEQVRIRNLSNDQVSHIIGFNEKHAENQCHEKDTSFTATNQDDMSQGRKLIVLTPEKLNQSIDECNTSRAPARTPGKLESLLPIEDHATESQMNSSTQRTLKRISSSAFQSSAATKSSLEQKLVANKQKSTNSSPLKQLLLPSDKSLISKRKKNASDRKDDSPIAKHDSRLSHRLTTARRDLNLQIFGEDQTPIKRNSMSSSKKAAEIEKNFANIFVKSPAKSLKKSSTKTSTKNREHELLVKFMQLGTLIKRRDVKYFYSGGVKHEQSLPAEVRVVPVHNMQRSVSGADIERHMATKLRNLALSPNDSQHSNNIIMVDNAFSMGLHENLATPLKNADLPSAYKVPDASISKKNINLHPNQIKTQLIEHYQTSTDQSNKSIREKKETNSSRIHQRPRADNNASKDQTSRASSTGSIKLLSSDKDSRLKLPMIDSPMNEHEELVNLTQRQFEFDKSAAKENSFSEAKSLRTATCTPSTSQQPSSESSEYIFKSDKKRKRRIVDEEQSVNELSNESNSSAITIKLNEYDSGLSEDAKLDTNRKCNTPHSQNNEEIALDSNEQDSRLKKYKRIIPNINYDSESGSSAHDMRNQKRRKTDDQQGASITNTSKERLTRQLTDEDLCIQNIVNRWSNEHNAMQKKLTSKSSQSSSGDKLSSHQSRLINSLETEKRSSPNQKISGMMESNMFESNSVFHADNMDYILQQMPNKSQMSQRSVNLSNEDIINKVLQIDRSTSRSGETSQKEKDSREHLLHDNFDEIIANVELPQGVTSQTEQPNRSLPRTLMQQKTSNHVITKKPCANTQESSITISSTDDIFEHRDDFLRKSTLSQNVALGSDKENIMLHNQKKPHLCKNDQKNMMGATIDLTIDVDDKDCHRKAVSKYSALRKIETSFNCIDTNKSFPIDKEHVSVNQLRIDDSKAQKTTVASDESKNNSFEDDTLMNVTQHQAQLQIFEEDLFGVPASRNHAKATKIVSQNDPPREEQDSPEKKKQDTKTAHGEYPIEEDDVVENTPEKKMKNSGNNVSTIKSRKNIATLYSSPISNQCADRTPSTSDISKRNPQRSGASTPMSQLEMCPLYQSTPKVAHVSAMAIKCDSENKKTKLMASGNILSARQMDCGMLENAPLQPDRQKLCFVCSGLTAAQVRHVREFAKEYDADYVNQFKPDVTHVIVNTTGKENATKSTLKYLQGIAHRKWIISYRWIEDCHRERKLLDEVSYEATTQYDSFYETGPRNSRLREKGLFEGFTFLCIEPYINVTLSQYQDLLLATGATVVDSLEALAKTEGLRGIVIQDDKTRDDETIEYWYRTAKAAPIIVDWIVECIGQYKLFKLAPYIQCLSLQDFYAIGYPRELVEEEEYSDDET